ncbi:MAG: L-serine ammonia-lyase [SAR324 cluster bacterium]|uniref:L-serine dehydratase n=1 Tax=SAR324 cluster bacterium TaxID=2024889 RepID=A0A2A4SZ07_9DELT|nr:MAG: L-serine ammonia-lyase [SAR324 cluster bacterium]
MFTSIFELFSIGIGPSSSHTVGPMKAARDFLLGIEKEVGLKEIASLQVDLYGSLALTGKGHATDTAILLGLCGETPEKIEPEQITGIIENINQEERIHLLGGKPIRFVPASHLLFHYRESLEYHSNGMSFSVYNSDGECLARENYYSIGGGFVMTEAEIQQGEPLSTPENTKTIPYPFATGQELLDICQTQGMTIAEVMWKNELTIHSSEEIRDGLLHIWKVMDECIQRGCKQKGELPGGLKVRRRAANLYQKLLAEEKEKEKDFDPSMVMAWVSLFAMAVNEENAAGGKVVTAPTNGASGIIPSVLKYYLKFIPGANQEGIVTFLLTAGAIEILFKKGASISGAEVGCQGEVGVACSMAAAGMAAILGGTPEQVENAAEIGMEHHLGLTCDPIGGLVQIPCIERNALGAVTAINSAQLAIRGDGQHHVSLDKVIATMRQTGADMLSRYKETSEGGLAVNLPEC